MGITGILLNHRSLIGYSSDTEVEVDWIMNWLGKVCALIAISIFLYLILQASRFSKELKKAIHKDRSISKKFAHRWEKKFLSEIILVSIAIIFGIIAFLFEDVFFN